MSVTPSRAAVVLFQFEAKEVEGHSNGFYSTFFSSCRQKCDNCLSDNNVYGSLTLIYIHYLKKKIHDSALRNHLLVTHNTACYFPTLLHIKSTRSLRVTDGKKEAAIKVNFCFYMNEPVCPA